MNQAKIRYKIFNPFDRSAFEKENNELAYNINHNPPKYNGIRYARLNGISLHDVFSRAESIRAFACVEERDTILLINGSNRGELFYRTLKSIYGDDRFSSDNDRR